MQNKIQINNDTIPGNGAKNLMGVESNKNKILLYKNICSKAGVESFPKRLIKLLNLNFAFEIRKTRREFLFMEKIKLN